MNLFQINKKYKLITKNQNQKVKIYTALILEEDDIFVKFEDKDNKEIILKKDLIQEVKDEK